MRRVVLSLLAIGVVLSIAWLLLSFQFPSRQALRIAAGVLYLLVLPGFVWTSVFFKGEKKIDWIERIALSFVLSLAIVPSFVLLTNALGVAITPANVFLETLVLLVLGAFILVTQSIFTTVPRRDDPRKL